MYTLRKILRKDLPPGERRAPIKTAYLGVMPGAFTLEIEPQLYQPPTKIGNGVPRWPGR